MGGGFGNSGEDFPGDKREDLASPGTDGLSLELGMEFMEFSCPAGNFCHLNLGESGDRKSVV